MGGHPFLSESPVAIAHRGGLSEHPENTLVAFEHAVGLGYVYLETDVHLSADGVLVAFHDADLLRTCGIEGDIAHMTWAELSEALVDEREPIPLMRDLFERFPDARFNIDAKSAAAVEPLADLVDELGVHDRVCLAAFSYRRIRAFRRRFRDRVATNLAPHEILLMKLFGWTPGSSPRIAQVPPDAGPMTLVTERFVRRCHRRGIPVHVWTIDAPEEMERLLDVGVDGVMTDRPERLRDVFRARGIWRD